MNIRFLIAAIFATTAFAFTGCGEKDPVGDEVPPHTEPDYVMTISDVAVLSAKAEVTPKDKTKIYLVDYITATDYAYLGGKPECISEYVPEYLAELSKRQQMPIANIVEALSHYGDRTGDKAVTLSNMEPETDYIAYVVGIDRSGKTTNLAVVEPFTTRPQGDVPQLTLSMTPGNSDGNDVFTSMTVKVKSSGVIRGLEGLYKASQIATLLSSGMTYDEILISYGASIEPDDITAINSEEGMQTSFVGLEANTKYTYIIRVANDEGYASDYRETSTADPGPATDAFKAWLGTWTVTSTSSEIQEKPISFDIIISNQLTNNIYSISGWSISYLRTNNTAYMDVDARDDGSFVIHNLRTLGSISGNPVMSTVRYLNQVSNKYEISAGGFPAIIGTMGSDKTTATAVGRKFNLDNTNFPTVSCLDYFVLNEDYSWNSLEADENFMDGDYPIGPYTLVKKSSSTASTTVSSPSRTPQSFVFSKESRLGVAKNSVKSVTQIDTSGI